MSLSTLFQQIKTEAAKVIVGQEEVFEQIVIAFFSGGHVLLEGVPGTAKTLMAKTLAQLIDARFGRIQFTADLMPSDVIGTQVFDINRGQFYLKQGPIFTNIALADEINRAPAKTQSALLEAMEERQVTIDGERHVLSDPFMVLATQNPIEYEGTYPLPEAQLDRFMFNIWVDYPSYAEELAIVKATTGDVKPHIEPVLSALDILTYQGLVRRIPVADNVLEYAVKLATRTRPGAADAPAIIKDHLSWGAGPRASQYLVIGAKCHALTRGKFSPDIDDVQAVALPILRHRLVRNYKAEAEGVTVERIVQGIL